MAILSVMSTMELHHPNFQKLPNPWLFVNALSGVLQQGLKCTWGKLCTVMY